MLGMFWGRRHITCSSYSAWNGMVDAPQAAGNVLTAVSKGDLTPIEAKRAMGLIDSYRRTLELTEIEHRLQALEHRVA